MRPVEVLIEDLRLRRIECSLLAGRGETSFHRVRAVALESNPQMDRVGVNPFLPLQESTVGKVDFHHPIMAFLL